MKSILPLVALFLLFSCSSTDSQLKDYQRPCVREINLNYQDKIVLKEVDGSFVGESLSPDYNIKAGLDVTGIPFVEIHEYKNFSGKRRKKTIVYRIIKSDGVCKSLQGRQR